MPLLRALRFDSIGHDSARLDGLVLEVVDAAGAPADSVLWLRNGGGKSSILSLAFNVVRPGQRHFMGKEQDARSRQLADYVAEDDTGTVTLEWQLENGDTLLTACTLEHAKRGQARELRALFWSVRVPPRARGTWSVHTLPLWETTQGTRHFRRMAALREYLRSADGKDGVSIVIEERHSEWAKHLATFGLDHEVFGYQVEMNRREGGADELFRFKTTAEFVDFILEVVVEHDQPALVCGNIERHKDKVKQRPQLLAQVDGLEQVLGQLRPLHLLAEKRADTARAMAETAGALHTRERGMAVTAELQRARSAEENAAAERHRAAANEAERQRNQANWSARVFRYRRARLLAKAAQSREADAARALAESEVGVRVADALVPLQLLDTEKARAELVRKDLERLHEENRPLLEELQQRATVLLRALEREVAQLDDRARAIQRRQEELEREKLATGERRDGLLRQQATVAAQLEAEQARYRRLQAERVRLEGLGALLVGEGATEAVVRVENARAAEEARERELRSEGERHAATRDASLEEHLRADAQANQHAREREAITAEVARAQRAWDSLAQNPLFAETLEVEEPRLPAMAAQFAARLREEAARRRDRHLILREEQAHDARSVLALETHGLTPPSLAAQQVLRALRDKGIHANHGLGYLAENATRDLEDRIRSQPALASGVVVPAAAHARVDVDALAAAVTLDVPVVIGTNQALLEGGQRHGDSLVVLPRRAAFDRRAAAVELERLRTDAARREHELVQLARVEVACNGLAAQLDAELHAHSTEWFLEREAACRNANHQECAAREASRAALRRRDEAAELEAAARASLVECTSRLRLAEKHGGLLVAFVRDGGADLDALMQSLGDLEVRLAALRTAQQDADALLSRVEQDLRQTRERFHAVSLERQPLAHEADKVRPHALGAGAEDTLPLENARHAYDLARTRYERTVSDNALHGQLKEIERAVARHAGDVDRRCREAGLELQLLREALVAALERGGVDSFRGEAEARRAHAETERKAAMKASAEAHAAMVEPEKSYLELSKQRSVVEQFDHECSTWTVDELDAAIVERDAVGVRASQEGAAEADARTLALERAAVAEQAATLADQARRTASLALDNAASFEMVRAIRLRPVEQEERRDPAETQREVDALAERLVELRTALEAADRDAQSRSADLVRLMSSAARGRIPTELAERLETRDVAALLDSAGQLVDDVAVYVSVTRKDLEQVDRDRDLLAEELLAVADPAVKILEGLERSSLFPSHVEVWGDVPFIRARVKKPGSPQERLALMANVVDALVRDERVPSPLGLVQRGVRELTAAGIHLEIIKPEVHRRLAYVPVEHMASFSGGERLTAAILLFCTLVRLRFRKRGVTGSAGQVLFLDNPIGTCSRRELVALQRSMAAAHGVQLVYTTGVEDLEALGELPNRVRIRNESRDVRGRLHATLDARDAAPMQAVRVTTREGADAP